MKGQRSGFSQRHGVGIAAIMFMAASLVAGCAGTSGGGAPDRAAVDDPMAMCRVAIADVGRFCAGEEADANACTDAKARSSEYCLED